MNLVHKDWTYYEASERKPVKGSYSIKDLGKVNTILPGDEPTKYMSTTTYNTNWCGCCVGALCAKSTKPIDC